MTPLLQMYGQWPNLIRLGLPPPTHHTHTHAHIHTHTKRYMKDATSPSPEPPQSVPEPTNQDSNSDLELLVSCPKPLGRSVSRLGGISVGRPVGYGWPACRGRAWRAVASPRPAQLELGLGFLRSGGLWHFFVVLFFCFFGLFRVFVFFWVRAQFGLGLCFLRFGRL